MFQTSTPKLARVRRTLTAGAFAAVPAMFWVGCGSDEKSSGCTPGATQECNCSATVRGVQACAADGASFAACDCSPTGSGAGGAAGGGGNAGAGSSMAGTAGTSMGSAGTNQLAEFTGATGLPCAVDTDCFGGMTCLPSTAVSNPFGDGGPQRGICTQTCTGDAAGSEACSAVDSFSDCISFEGAGNFCWPLCPLGVANAQRCTGRRDLGCSDTLNDPQVGICRPQCSSDVDCAGRLCDLGTGFCVDTVPVRGPGGIGAACTLDTEQTDCVSGFCLDVQAGGVGFCTAPCVIGSVAGCGFSATAAPRDAACFSLSPTSVLGDRGLCLELCDTVADCAQGAAGYTCTEQTAAAQQGLGRFGQCVPPLPAGADAGADGG